MQTVDAADYHEIATPADPRVAPGGERVAFVRRAPADDERTEATVYVVPTGGGEARRFSLAEGEDSEPRWSPSGDRLAFVSTRGADDDRPQLWVVPADGGEARQVTDVAGGVSSIAWSSDGSRIAFCQQVSEDDREADRDLSVPDDYEPEPPDPRVVDRTVYRSGQRYFDGARSHVYVATLADDTAGSEDAVRRLTDGDADYESPTWGDAETLYYAERVGADPDDSLAYEILGHDVGAPTKASDRDAGGPAEVDGPGETADPDDAAVERLHRTTAWVAGLAATADGRVAHLYQDDDRATLRPTELRVYDRSADSSAGADATDAAAVTHPTAALDRSLGLDAFPRWGPDEELLYFTAPDRGRVPVWRAGWDGSTGPEPVVTEGHVDGIDVGADLLAYTQSEWDHPGDVFVATKGGGETRRLTRLNADYLDGRAVARPEPVPFDSENGTRPTTPDGEPAGAGEAVPDQRSDGDGDVQGWVLTPPSFGGPGREDGDEQFPLVVEVHGGPHAMWSTAGTMWHEFQALAARGYVVFWCNPRGSTGYGEEFAAAIERDWGSVTAADVLAGARTVADRPYVADQWFLTGGSFGGFVTSWLVGHTDAFDAAVAQRGVYDLTGFYGSTDAAYKLVEGDFDTTPWDEPDFLWEHSPVAYCDRVTTPTLVVHSDEDYRTPANTAELFHRGLRKHGVDTRLVRYPREGHELSRSGEPGHVVDRIERIARWFDGYSDCHDAPRALDRPDEAGLSAGDDEAADEDTDGEREASESTDDGGAAGGRSS